MGRIWRKRSKIMSRERMAGERMAGSAWPGAHGRERMAGSAWPGAHGPGPHGTVVPRHQSYFAAGAPRPVLIKIFFYFLPERAVVLLQVTSLPAGLA